PNHPSIGTADYDLGNVLRDSGRPKEAETYYQQALRIRQTALGPTAPGVADVLEDYAKLLRGMHRDAEAERLEARAHDIRSAAK
ncbi:MAG: tetratricopeptide repeat protein, partial [Gemmatimonadaceae bacterium]